MCRGCACADALPAGRREGRGQERCRLPSLGQDSDALAPLHLKPCTDAEPGSKAMRASGEGKHSSVSRVLQGRGVKEEGERRRGASAGAGQPPLHGPRGRVVASAPLRPNGPGAAAIGAAFLPLPPIGHSQTQRGPTFLQEHVEAPLLCVGCLSASVSSLHGFESCTHQTQQQTVTSLCLKYTRCILNVTNGQPERIGHYDFASSLYSFLLQLRGDPVWLSTQAYTAHGSSTAQSTCPSKLTAPE